MRILIPATAIVVALILAVQVFIDQDRIDLPNAARSRRLWQANVAAPVPPTSQPATQPANEEVLTSEESNSAR